MWPDDNAPWHCSPRHSYLQSCEKQRLLPHPRLLQFTQSLLPSPKSPLSPSKQPAVSHLFVAPFGFVADQKYLGDAGLEACIPLIRAVLAAGGERGQQLHLINVGITRSGIRSLGQHLESWCLPLASGMRVADIDFSGNSMSCAAAPVCSICHLQPIIRTNHIRRLVLSGCKCVFFFVLQFPENLILD
jgi:hypothetical protein